MDNDTQIVEVNLTRIDVLMASLWAPLRMPALYLRGNTLSNPQLAVAPDTI